MANPHEHTCTKGACTQGAALSPICTQKHTCIDTRMCAQTCEQEHSAQSSTYADTCLNRPTACYVLMYIHVHRVLHVLQKLKAQSRTHHQTSAYPGPLALPLDLSSPFLLPSNIAQTQIQRNPEVLHQILLSHRQEGKVRPPAPSMVDLE